MSEPGERLSMEELAALNRSTTGLECPACGCRHFHVRKTVRGDNLITRKRRCRNCGHEITTYETGGPLEIGKGDPPA